MRKVFGWLALVLSAAVQPAMASDFEALYSAGMTARANGAHVEAQDLFMRALDLAPWDPDALVQMGYTKLALEDARGASEAFNKALEQAPDYADAQRGLARASLQAGDLERSAALYRKRLEHSGEGADWLGLGDAYRAAGRESEARSAYRASLADPAVAVDARRRMDDTEFLQSRLDLSISGSKIGRSADEWRDTAVRISRKTSAETSVSAGAELGHRFGATDLFLDVRVDHRIGKQFTGYVMIGGTRHADFRPDAAVELGVVARISGGAQSAGAADGLLSLRQELHGNEAITTIKAGLEQELMNGRFQISGRAIAVMSEHDGTAVGWSAQGRAAISDQVNIFGGYSDTAEVEAGQLADVQASFAGISFNYDPVSRVGLIYAVEERAPDIKRQTLSLTHSIRF